MRGLPYKPRVFISHSTKVDEPQAVRFLSRLHETLVQATNTEGTGAFEVLLDQESLSMGEPWRDEIDEWVDSCDAAVIVLSEAATHSDNVKRELTLLQKRQRSHPNYLLLLPVCLPSVTDEHLKKRMPAQQITELQIRRLTEDNENEVLEELVSHLHLRLPQQVWKHEIEENLFSLFCFSFVDEELKPISDVLHIRPILAGAQIDRARAIIRTLLGGETESHDIRFSKLRRVLERLQAKNDPEKSKLLNWVFPFCWVNAEAAGRLCDIAVQAARNRVVGWGREWELSEQMYLVRGYCHTRACTIHISNLDGGIDYGDGEDTFLDHLTSCLYHNFFGHQPRNVGPKEIRRRLCKIINDKEQAGEPVFLIIPLDAVDKKRVQLILNEFPNVTLFFHSETLTPSAFADLEFPNAEFLSPPLDRETEWSANAEYIRLRALSSTYSTGTNS